MYPPIDARNHDEARRCLLFVAEQIDNVEGHLAARDVVAIVNEHFPFRPSVRERLRMAWRVLVWR